MRHEFPKVPAKSDVTLGGALGGLSQTAPDGFGRVQSDAQGPLFRGRHFADNVILAEAGILSELAELDHRSREGPTAPAVGEHLSYTIEEMLHSLYQGGRRFMRRQDGPCYAEVFVRFLFEVTER